MPYSKKKTARRSGSKASGATGTTVTTKKPSAKRSANKASEERTCKKRRAVAEIKFDPPLVATINFVDGAMLSSATRHDGSAWSSDSSGVMSAQLTARHEPCRLMGYRRIEFQVKNEEKVWKWLCRPIPGTEKIKPKSHKIGIEYFNCDGEPELKETEGRTTVSRLLAACNKGNIVAKSSEDVDFLSSLHVNQRPQFVDRFKAPVFRTLCYRLEQAHEANKLFIEIRVYATRILFYLIADESIRKVFSGLEPLGKIRKLTQPPSCFDQPALLVNTKSNAQTPFTLEAVMRSAEHPGGPEADQPSAIALEMKPYQRQALYWMCQMEDKDLNQMFWERREFYAEQNTIHHEDQFWYYAPDLGECRLELPPRTSGGILSDEMGLGKTLESVALICARPATKVDDRLLPPVQKIEINQQDDDEEMDGTVSINDEAQGLIRARATLVIVPAALASQWVDECAKSCNPGSLRVGTIFTQQDRNKYCYPFSTHRRISESTRQNLLIDLASNDIVITTYGIINTTSAFHERLLGGIYWHRLLLDEMQYVASPNTQLARRCASLRSRTRWMVSGTPLSDGIGDLNGELRFLGIWPFSLSDASDGFWEHCVGNPWNRREPEALTRLECLLRRVVLRRSKAQSYAYGPLLSRPLLDLPRRGDVTVAVTPPPAETGVLLVIDALAAAVISKIGTSHADLCLRLMRQSTTSTRSPLLQDADLNALCRLYNQRIAAAAANASSAFAGSGLISFQPHVLSPGDAIEMLTSRDRSRHEARGRRDQDDLLVGGISQRQRVAMDNYVGGSEAVTTARNSSRVLSTLALSQRLQEARAQFLHFERLRIQYKTNLRKSLLNWMLLQLFLGRGDSLLSADVTLGSNEEEERQEQVRTRAQVGSEDPALVRARAVVCDRRRMAIGRFLVQTNRAAILSAFNEKKSKTVAPLVGSDDRRLDLDMRPIPFLRWLCTEDKSNVVKSGNDQLDIFSWQNVRKETSTCSEKIGEIQLQLLSITQHIRRLEASVLELRTQRDAKIAQSEHFYSKAAQFRSKLQEENSQIALLKLVDELNAATVAYETTLAETGLEQRTLVNAKASAESQLSEAQAARLASATDEEQKKEALVLTNSERELCDALSQARAAARDSRKLAEELGADATEEQKKEYEALQKRKPLEDADKTIKDAWRNEEKQFRQSLPAEARHFFYPTRTSVGINTQSGEEQLQYRVTQQGVKDLSRLEDPRERPAYRCPCCFGYLDYEFSADSKSALRLCVTPCLHLTCESCAVNQILHAGVQNAIRNRFITQQGALTLANEGRLEAPCIICRRSFRLEDCILVTRGPPPTLQEVTNQAIPDIEMDHVEETLDEDAPPRFHAAIDVEKALQLPPLDSGIEPLRDVRHPNIPLELLRYLSVARQQAHSAKIALLISDIKRILRDDPCEKMVVFTTIRAAVEHVAADLYLSGIGHETLVTGNSSGISDRVRRWQNDDTCNVFVVNAGVAAAGLTLTAARYMFLLEPFLSKGQEIQAMNRYVLLSSFMYTSFYSLTNKINILQVPSHWSRTRSTYNHLLRTELY
uniref:Helicase ATP-binding domain-containing protein n=1 Tax=Aureoumbra lagunensis TaxID=44058 RepID=A0A7S3NEC6_9STRA